MTNYRTDFFNHSGRAIRANLFIDGQQRIYIQPTKEGVLSGHIIQGKDCLFAGYSKIIYQASGKIKAVMHKGFKPTKGPWVVELVNDSLSVDIQILSSGLKSLHVPRGISIFHNPTAIEQVAEFSLIRWTEPEPTGNFRTLNRGGMLEQVSITQDCWKVRKSPEQLKKLFNRRSELVAIEKEKDLKFQKEHEARRLRLEQV